MIHLQTQKIIITTDFSETADLAISHGAFLAQYTKGDVHLVHVISKHWEKFNPFSTSISVADIEQASKAVVNKLEDLANAIRTKYGVTVITSVFTGNPTSEIVAYAKEINAGLIVMGTHGYSSWEDLTIGSNALKVITKSACPVMTMSEHAQRIGYSKIVLPIDTSEHTRHKVNFTIDIAKQFSAHIYAVGLLAGDEGSKKPATEVILSQIEKMAKDKGVVCTTELLENVKNRAEATVKYTQQVGADLTVIMTDQDAEISGLFLGTYALQVIHHSKVPVISVKPEDHPENVSSNFLGGTAGL
jgi:nucleotide-binding universal stress UspA family protein